MTTIKSFFSSRTRLFSLYKTTLKSLYPTMVVFSIVFFLAMPFVFIATLVNGGMSNVNDRFNYNFGIYHFAAGTEYSVVIHAIAGVMALMLALFTNSYMHGKKNVDLYHAIPATRTELLGANLLASMTTIVAPLLGNYIFMIAAESIAFLGKPLINPLYHCHNIQDVISIVLFAAVVYLFITFISVNVGTMFDTFSISLILGVAPLCIYAICGSIWGNITYGARFLPDMWIRLLSPFTFIFYKFDAVNFYNFTWTEFGKCLLFLLCAAIFAAGLFVVCTVRYRKRHSEIAEQPQTSGTFQTAVKVFAAFLGAALMYAIFSGSPVGGQVFAAFIGAVLIGVIAELVFSRGVKSLLKNILWLAGTGAVCCVLILGVHFDVTGYEDFVPADSDIESVSINRTGRFSQLISRYGYFTESNISLTYPESIAAITQAHRIIIDNKPMNNNDYAYSIHSYAGLRIEYKLKNGNTVSRYYDRVYYEAFPVLATIEDKDDYIVQSSPIFYFDRDDIRDTVTIAGISVTDSLRTMTHSLTLSVEDTRRLIDALKTDMLNESLSEIFYPTQPDFGFVTIDYNHLTAEIMRIYTDYGMTWDYGNAGTTCSVLITHEYVNTLAVLRELSPLDFREDVYGIDSVYFVNAGGYLDDGVRVLTPHYVDNSFYQDIYRYAAVQKEEIIYQNGYSTSVISMTDDAAEVERLLSVAANQMLVQDRFAFPERAFSEEEYYNSALFYAIFCNGNTIIGTKMVRYADLPEHVKADVHEWYGPGIENITMDMPLK